MNKDCSNWLYDETKHAGIDYAKVEQAQRYDDMHRLFRAYQAITNAIVDRLGLDKGSTVIDMGAGTGAFAIHAATYCKQVYAVDVSKTMLDQCKAKADQANLKNITYCVGGFLTYEHDSEPADAAVSLIALHLERAQRTHTEEFYEVTDCCFEIPELKDALIEGEVVYNTIRPHQVLGYLTPKEFLECYQQSQRKEVMCH